MSRPVTSHRRAAVAGAPPGGVVTRYLSPQRVAEMVRRRGLAACIADVAAYLREDFLRWADFAKNARLAHHSPLGVIELMPISDGRDYSFKYVNGHPYNHRHALPTVMAFGVLAEVATGAPVLISELTLTTAIRTGAMSALAGSVLARAGARRMALIGNGAQSEFQALAFHELLGVEEFHLYDVDPAATTKLAANLDALGLRHRRFANTRAAVKGCDIVTTVTADKTRATILTAEMVEPGMFINGVGGDCPGKTELAAEVLRLGPVFCEYEPQSRVEGELQQMPADFPTVELWRVLAGEVPGRVDATQVNIFDSVGFALEDFSALRYLRDLADQLGVTDTIALIPALADPKNLYGYLGASALAPEAPAARVPAEAGAAYDAPILLERAPT